MHEIRRKDPAGVPGFSFLGLGLRFLRFRLARLSKTDSFFTSLKGPQMPSDDNISAINKSRARWLDWLKREYAAGKGSGEPEEIDAVAFLRELKAERSASS
jgi:hypothetical protein